MAGKLAVRRKNWQIFTKNREKFTGKNVILIVMEGN